MTPAETTSRPHQFEQAGLGLAPFTFDRMVEKWHQACPGAPKQPGSTCDYCGTGIALQCWVRSADGKTFKVGCDCIRKVDNARNKRAADPLTVAMDRARRAHDTAKRQDRERKRIKAGRAMIDANRERLAAMPHPQKRWAEKGQSFLDQVEWFMLNAGNSGKIRIIRQVEKSLAAEQGDDAELEAAIERANREDWERSSRGV